MTNIAEQHKSRLREYFDGVGFERWAAIYGDAELSGVRRTIRAGHAEMMQHALAWLSEQPSARVLDAGCGTGLLTVALAQRGMHVTAVDIAPQMAAATARAAAAAGVAELVDASSGDLEAVSGQFDAVVCLDVLIHYPPADFAQICTRLAGLAQGRLLLTYAPREPVLAALHWLGGRFPSGQRRQNIHMLPAAFVRDTLAQAGMQIRRSARVSRGFYHVTLLEATR